jgi:predicted metal-dependent peptidase
MLTRQSTHFERERLLLIVDHPFFAVPVLHLIEREMDLGHPFIQQLVLPTCGVDGKHLWVNPEFVSSLDAAERLGVLGHEILHLVLGHVWIWRRRWRNPMRWNAAADYVVNLILSEEGFTLPKGGLLDERFVNMSVEQVY